jgi:putative cell wall-binding protein
MRHSASISTLTVNTKGVILRLLLVTVLALSGLLLATPAWADETDRWMPMDASAILITQHEGADRDDTAARASQKAYPDSSQVDAVIMAFSYDFPDALTASYLAGALNAPILLGDTTSVDLNTTAEINRLSPSTIYIVGGEGVISKSIEDGLNALPSVSSVVRLGGEGRAETAYKIATEAKNEAGVPTSAFVVDAANFPDALSAGSLAAGQKVPILLTDKGNLDGWTRQFLMENNIKDIIIVGGVGSVSTQVETELRQLSYAPLVSRWAGDDRFATSKDVLVKASARWNLAPRVVGLASGWVFPDALVGGASIGNRGGFLAITDPDTLSDVAQSVITTHRASLFDIEIFGGTGTIRVKDKVQALLG